MRQGFFEYEEVVALAEHLPDYLQDFVWFGYYPAGARARLPGWNGGM